MITKIALALFGTLAVNSALLAQESDTFPTPSELEKLQELIETDPDTFREETRNELGGKGAIIGIQQLPINKIFFVEAEHGNYLVTADGRFIIQGSLTDTWHRKRINNLADARRLERTPLRNMKFEPLDELAAVQVGNPNIPRQGLVFADPTSNITQRFMKEVLENPDKYNFTVAMMPLIGGEAAVDRAQRIYCATDREQAIQDLANYTSESLGDVDPDCDISKLMLTMYMQEIFRVTNLPHFIREDGLVSEGLPENLNEWLEKP